MKSDPRNQRPRRGLELARVKHQRFRRIADHVWLVPSATRKECTYVVNTSRATCTCPDFGENGGACKHLWAVAYIQNEITLLDGTRLAPPPVANDEQCWTSIKLPGAS